MFCSNIIFLSEGNDDEGKLTHNYKSTTWMALNLFQSCSRLTLAGIDNNLENSKFRMISYIYLILWIKLV